MKFEEVMEKFEELREKLKQEPPILFDNARKLAFIGDIHGDIETVEYVKESLLGKRKVVFLGDFVDRGEKGTEVACEVADLKLGGEGVVILPGNHDISLDVYPRNWRFQLMKEFGPRWREVELAYISAMKEAPIAYVNSTYRLLALHGFIPKRRWEIEKWEKGDEEIVWNDPEITGGAPGRSPRGVGWIISKEETLEFLRKNSLSVIVRSHQPYLNKVFEVNGFKVVNIGSSSYCGRRGCYLLPEGEIVTF
ncbi:MAG: metallophosphoesterase family protein [Candidatus Freyarchaeota archaeon]